MKEIQLTQGYVAIVDDDDYDELSKHRWFAHIIDKSVYVCSYKQGYMHRLIMKNPKGFEVDHINNNPLDNRKENLRICTRRQNSYNRSNKVSGRYKGVYSVSGSNKFFSLIKIYQTSINLGTFETQEEAAHAYDKKAIELFGEYACLNFPDNRVTLQ